ncbi:MAG: DUF3892 domain-containing protein [Acidimicrobiia bacterium]
MNFGDVWMALGIDLQVLQGAVTHLYRERPDFQVIEDPGAYRLELVIPTIEVRPECGDLPHRMGVHLLGNLFLGDSTDALLFDAWVRLAPAVADPVPEPEGNGLPAGTLSFVDVESVTPEFAGEPLAEAFAPDGAIGSVLAGFRFDLFSGLLDSATRILHPPADPEDPVDIDLDEFAVDFWLGQPAPLRRPYYTVEDDEPQLEIDGAEITVPALVATVALAGTSPRMVGDPSIVRPGTGLQLVTTKAAFDAKLDVEQAATIGTEVEGLTIDSLELEAVDGGITVDGSGHKTGATVTFEGTIVARYQGGTDGHLVMQPAVDTDVDLDTWLEVLSAVGIVLFPVIGLIVVDVLVWQPAGEAPGKIDKALQEKFTEPLADIGSQLADGFGVDGIPSAAFLSDLWIFDGNLGVAAAALLGHTPTDVLSVTYDVALIAPDPDTPTNRRRPVKSVAEIRLTSGHRLTPWQAAAMLRDGVIGLPGYHAVHQPLARGEWYLRSNPNDDLDDNLVR